MRSCQRADLCAAYCGKLQVYCMCTSDVLYSVCQATASARARVWQVVYTAWHAGRCKTGRTVCHVGARHDFTSGRLPVYRLAHGHCQTGCTACVPPGMCLTCHMDGATTACPASKANSSKTDSLRSIWSMYVESTACIGSVCHYAGQTWRTARHPRATFPSASRVHCVL